MFPKSNEKDDLSLFEGLRGHVAVVQALFEKGVDYNQTVTKDTTKDRCTPLQLACK